MSLTMGVGPHLTQCSLGRRLPPYQVASRSIQPFGHNTPTLQTDSQDIQWSDSTGETKISRVTRITPVGSTGVQIPNGISIGSAVFQSSWQSVAILYNGPLLPSALITVPSHKGGSQPHLTHDSWAHLSPQSKRHLDRLSCFCRDHYCDRQTDRQRHSVGNNRPHLRT